MTARKGTMSINQIAVATAVLLIFSAGNAAAADWSFDPEISLDAVSDDNNRMADIPGQEIEVFGVELAAQLSIRAESPRGSFSLVPRLRSTLYPGDEQDESDDRFLNLNWEHRGERFEVSLKANYWQLATFGRYFPGSTVPADGELGEPDPGTPVGRSAGQNEEERIEASPTVTFALTERTALVFRGGRRNVNYDQQILDDREDYTDTLGAAGLRFRISPTATLAVIAGASRFNPDDGSGNDGNSLNAEWSNRISETSQVILRGGANRFKSDDIGDSGWKSGFSAGGGVRWSFEVTQLFVDVNHYLDASSSGRLVERDQLRFQLSRRLGPLTTLIFAARGIRDVDAANDPAFEDRKYAAASVELEWRMSRQFALSGGYDYAWRKFGGVPNDAVSNAFHLGITYEPHRL
jgi:hypothetical protein